MIIGIIVGVGLMVYSFVSWQRERDVYTQSMKRIDK